MPPERPDASLPEVLSTPTSSAKRRVGIFDVSQSIDDEGRDVGRSKMTEDQNAIKGPQFFRGKNRTSKEQIKGIPNIFKKIWKHNLFKPYYEQKEIIKATAAIEGSKMADRNIYANETADLEAHQEAMGAVVERMISDYDEVVHNDIGEHRETLGNSPEEQAIATRIKDLVRTYAGGTGDEDAFKEEQYRIFEDLRTVRGDALDKGRMYADNVFKIADECRKAVESGEAIDAVVGDLEIVIGRAKAGARTESKLNTVEQIVEKIQTSKLGRGIGRFVNEATLTSAVALTYSVLSGGLTRVTRSRIAGLFSFGGTAALGGAIAGVRESKMLEDDLAQHSRDIEKGKKVDYARAPRRTEIEKYRNKTKDANEMSSQVLSRLYEEGSMRMKELNAKDLNVAIAAMTEIQSRLNVSNKHKIGLISYTDQKMSVENTHMELLLARAKADIKAYLDRPDKTAERAGVIIGSGSFLDHFNAISGMKEDLLVTGDQGIEAKRKSFKAFKKWEIGKAVGKGILTGLIVGGTVQEGLAFIKDQQEGFIEGMITGHDTTTGGIPHYTAAETVRRFFSGDLPGGGGLGPLHEIAINGHPFRLPDGIDMIKNPDGSFNLMQGGDIRAENILINPDGTVPAGSIDALRELGINVRDEVQHVVKMIPGHMKPQEFIDKHGGATKIHRDLWWDNDTPKPKFDKNELKLWWGGENNTGLDVHGNYVYNVSQMQPDGSYHGPLSADAKALMKAGKLKMLFSLHRDTQHEVFELPIDTDGNAIVPPGSDLGKILFTTEKGHAKFLGKFAEVAEVTDKAPDGADVVRIFATDTGEGLSSVPVEIPQVVDIHRTVLDIPPDYRIDLPPVIPFGPRTPLERASNTAEVRLGPYYYSAGTVTGIEQYFRGRDITPQPYVPVKRDGVTELRNEDGSEILRRVERENEAIRGYLEKEEAGYKDELRDIVGGLEPMHEKCRVAIVVPALLEARNIGNFLDQYSKQMDENGNLLDPDLYEINVIVNRRKSMTPDDSVEVIQRWKAEHPAIHVNVIDIAFEDSKACVGLARKYVTDSTLMRSVNRPKSAGPLYLESEDADMFGIDKRTVAKLINDFDKNPSVDVLRGLQDRQPEVLQKNSLLFFARRMWDIGEMIMRDTKYRPDTNPEGNFIWNRVISGGWNTAYTAEVYAQIGGHNPDLRIGEDMDIGQKISVFRGQRSGAGRIIPNTMTAKTSGLRSSSNPRRFIDAMVRNIDPYSDFDNQALKSKSLDELLEGISRFADPEPRHRAKFEKQMNTIYSFFRNLYGAGSAIPLEAMKRTMTFMGLKIDRDYTLSDAGVRLRSAGMSQIGSLIKNYRDERRWLLGYRRQNAPLGTDVNRTRQSPERRAMTQRASVELINSFFAKTIPSPIVETNFIPTGIANEVYGVKVESGNEYIVRVARSTDQVRFNEEKWAIDRCREAGIPVPEVLAIDTVNIGGKKFSACIETRLPGTPLEDMTSLPEETKKDLLRQAGGLLAQIHSIPVDGYGKFDENGKGIYTSAKETLSGSYIRKEKMLRIAKDVGLGEDVLLKAFDIIDNGLALYPDGAKASLLHYDFEPKHILVSEGKVSGIIDFEEARGGDPVFDLARWHYYHSYRGNDVEDLMAGYGTTDTLSGDFQMKFNLWRVYLGLSHLAYQHEVGDQKQIKFGVQELTNDVNYWLAELKGKA